jgi:hypothetical protein
MMETIPVMKEEEMTTNYMHNIQTLRVAAAAINNKNDE